ncbi:hypothetical protein LQ50_25460 [Halalkalibacter okhensis]|uniref:Uncharacterized protein n=1 Tax=Halalkalibacter okhensis TaxID=333138 RepID=A0A0B0ICI4_9BACI|nr:hypothetical protein LQ50_25460 [Halalkalibacter okhensis]
MGGEQKAFAFLCALDGWGEEGSLVRALKKRSLLFRCFYDMVSTLLTIEGKRGLRFPDIFL